MKKSKQIITACCLFISGALLVFMTTNANAQKVHPLTPTCCPNAGPDKTIACGSTATLGGACACSQQNGECASTYTWSPTANLSCTNCANPTCIAPCPTTHTSTVTYTLSVNCPDGGFETDQVNVHFPACPQCSRIGHFNIDEEKVNQSIKVFPNPSSGKVSVEFNGSFDNAILQVYDLNGTLVKEIKVQEKTMQVDLSSVAKGTYFIQVASGDEGIFNKKIIIK